MDGEAQAVGCRDTREFCHSSYIAVQDVRTSLSSSIPGQISTPGASKRVLDHHYWILCAWLEHSHYQRNGKSSSAPGIVDT